MPDKRKIINDPVYGFIDIPGDFILTLIQSSWIQRLRHIRQLGLTNFVYPGAGHTRFQHSLGALHLMVLAMETLRLKGHEFSGEEEEAACAAILLHDTGHGPFSHALERSILTKGSHEDMSLLIMRQMNKKYNGRLSLAIDLFTDSYPRHFMHELIAGQTDMDRLDYLRRDSFYTGVIEGSVSSDRIIKMLNVAGDRLVIEEKGIYSIEKFLIARRLMYWQVYMHKTVIAAEKVLASVVHRARELISDGHDVYTTPGLRYFLSRDISTNDIAGTGSIAPDEIAFYFSGLDDTDILHCIKAWMDSPDRVLSLLSRSLMLRDLPAVELNTEPFGEKRIADLTKRAGELYGLGPELAGYLVFTGEVSNRAYVPDAPQVGIMLKNGTIRNIAEVSAMFDHSSLSEKTIKYFLCYPKKIR